MFLTSIIVLLGQSSADGFSSGPLSSHAPPPYTSFETVFSDVTATMDDFCPRRKFRDVHIEFLVIYEGHDILVGTSEDARLIPIVVRRRRVDSRIWKRGEMDSLKIIASFHIMEYHSSTSLLKLKYSYSEQGRIQGRVFYE